MTVDAERMRENLELTHGALFSQRVLLALVEAGMPRDDAYRIVQELAQRAWDEGIPLRELLAGDERARAASTSTRSSTTATTSATPSEIVARLDADRLSGRGPAPRSRW